MDASVETVRRELAAMRTGRASLSMLDSIRVDYYGTPTPLNQVGNLAHARPHPDHDPALGRRRCCRRSRRRSARSDLDLNPQNDGKIIRIPVPPLTEERRKNLVKHAHKHAEEGRVAIRNVRRDVNDHLKKLLKDHEVSEDDEKQAMAEVQKLTDQHIEQINEVAEEEGSGDHGGLTGRRSAPPLAPYNRDASPAMTCHPPRLHALRPAYPPGQRLQPVRRAAGRSSRATTSSARPRTCGPGHLALREPTLWRYDDVLPVEDPDHRVSLGEGFTPAAAARRRLGARRRPAAAASSRTRAATRPAPSRRAACASAVSMAKALGATDVCLPSAGNAGSALAAYAARGRAARRTSSCRSDVAPRLRDGDRGLRRATSSMVDGLITDAGKVCAAQAREHGWYECATLKEPYRVEGKKTMGYELAEQMGWKLPDAILYPTGGGTGLIGMWKAFAGDGGHGLRRPRAGRACTRCRPRAARRS